MRRQRGFTLMEAMVTVAMLAVLASVTGPGMADWIRRSQVRGVAEAARDGLQKARTAAMQRNQRVTFWMVSASDPSSPGADCLRSSTSGAWVVSIDDPAANCDQAPSPTAQPRLVEKYGPGVTNVVVAGLTADGGAANAVAFNGFGQATGGNDRLACMDIGHSDPAAGRLRLEITGTGGIRLCDPAATPPDLRACNRNPSCAAPPPPP